MNSDFETGNINERRTMTEAVRSAAETLLANLPLMICGAVVMLAVLADLLA